MPQAEAANLASPVVPAAHPERPAPRALPGRRRPSAAVAGAALGVLTFVAYLPGLGRSLDFDSAQTVGLFVADGPPWAAFGRQALFNNHPMFSFLEQLVRVVTGNSDAATMRLLPVLCAAAAVGALTWFTARRLGLLPAVVAGAVLAANPAFATLSRSVRGYSLLTLCAVVATVVVAEDHGDRSRWFGVAYVVAAGAGLATHLYMLPVIAAHLGAVVARGHWDRTWRLRFVATMAVAGLAYAGMARSMIDAAGAHSRVFQPDLPWRVATMATGSGWASLVLLPLVVVGGAVMMRGRSARGAALGLAAVLVVLWAVLQSSALLDRFFVWLVPAAAYLAAAGVARFRAGWVLGAGSAALAVAVLLPGYTSEPTAYRQAAALLRRVEATGARGCVVGVGVPPMLAYLDSPRDFGAVTRPGELEGCDTVVVATWWPTTADWFADDRAVIAAAEQRFPERLVLEVGDPALVLSNRPLGAPPGR